MTKKTILSVETGQAVKNVGDLRNNIKQYKKELEGLNIGSDEYRRTLTKLEENQAALRNAMHATAAGFTEVVNAATAANVKFDENNKLVREDTLSYNELVRGLAVLKEQWRATTNAAERQRVGEQIDQINNKLKTLDASVGVFGRNVGNYIGAVDHLTDGLSKMGGGASRVVQPIKNVNGALKLLSTNPVIAILGVLVTVIMKVVDALKSSEAGLESTTKAAGALAGVGEALTKILQVLGGAVAGLINGLVSLADKLGLVSDRMREKQALMEREIALSRRQRELIVETAETERDIADWRAKAADKENVAAWERLAYLDKAIKREQALVKERVAAAKEALSIYEAQNKATENAAEVEKRIAELRAAVFNEEKAEAETTRRLLKERNAMIKENQSALENEQKAAAATAKAVREAAQKEAEAFASFMDSMDGEIQAAIEANGAELLEGMEKDEKAAADKTKRMLDAVAAGVENRQAWNEVLTEDEQEQAENRYQIQMEGLTRQLEILEEARAEALDEGYLESVLAYEQQIADIKEEVALESAKREKEINKESEKDAENSAKQKKKIMQIWAGNISGLLGGIADAWEAMSDDEEKAAEQTKAIRIVTSIIDTISGAIGAYMSAVSPTSGIPAPYNMILGAIQAATVTATGMANIAKLRSTNVKGGGSGNASVSMPAAVSAPSVQPEVTTTRAITTDAEEERLNQMASPQRVYILDSDLQANEQARRVQVAETTF